MSVCPPLAIAGQPSACAGVGASKVPSNNSGDRVLVLKAIYHREKAMPGDVVVFKYPERPQKDVLLFLIEHAPLKPWQRDILSIIRDEAYYFLPQGQTKVMVRLG